MCTSNIDTSDGPNQPKMERNNYSLAYDKDYLISSFLIAANILCTCTMSYSMSY